MHNKGEEDEPGDGGGTAIKACFLGWGCLGKEGGDSVLGRDRRWVRRVEMVGSFDKIVER